MEKIKARNEAHPFDTYHGKPHIENHDCIMYNCQKLEPGDKLVIFFNPSDREFIAYDLRNMILIEDGRMPTGYISTSHLRLTHWM